MSYIFDFGNETVWSPGLPSGSLFYVVVEGLSQELSLPDGFVWNSSDMAAIERDPFQRFVSGVLSYYDGGNPMLRSLIREVLAILVVLAERCGISELEPSDLELNESVAAARGRMPT